VDNPEAVKIADELKEKLSKVNLDN